MSARAVHTLLAILALAAVAAVLVLLRDGPAVSGWLAQGPVDWGQALARCPFLRGMMRAA